jgi:hypothetical protein
MSVFNAMFGIILSSNLDSFFDKYFLGFRTTGAAISLSSFSFVSFNADEPLGKLCLPFLRKGGSKSFHNGHRPHGQPDYGGNFTWSSCRRPSSPASLLGYSGGIICLQCVLQKFADTEYKSLGHIYYSELPLEMEGDSDSDSTNSEADWPSAGLDRGRAL